LSKQCLIGQKYFPDGGKLINFIQRYSIPKLCDYCAQEEVVIERGLILDNHNDNGNINDMFLKEELGYVDVRNGMDVRISKCSSDYENAIDILSSDHNISCTLRFEELKEETLCRRTDANTSNPLIVTLVFNML
jgi:hypothetical protein